MFFVAAINKLQIQFTEYLTNATDKLPIQMIKLPVCLNVDGSPKIDFKYNYHSEGYVPDFEYMEKYIKATQKQVIIDVIKYKDDIISKAKMVVS